MYTSNLDRTLDDLPYCLKIVYVNIGLLRAIPIIKIMAVHLRESHQRIMAVLGLIIHV